MGIFSQIFGGTTNKKANSAAAEELLRQAAAQRAEQEEKKEQAMAEELAGKLPKMLEGAAKMFEREVPESGDMRDTGVCFAIPGRFVQKWFIIVSNGYSEPANRRLMISAEFPDDDRYERPMAGYIMSECLLRGTKQEIIDYLGTQECVDEIVKAVARLDKAVKNHD